MGFRQTPSIPRKGTETAVFLRLAPPHSKSDTLNSPQGDGNTPTTNNPLEAFNVRHPQFPARGRKLPPSGRETGSCPAHVRHPQFPARGRKLRAATEALSRNECQTPSIPRKGTETSQCWHSLSLSSVVRHPQFPARGRKPSYQPGRGCLMFSQTPSIPRKGTETPQASLRGNNENVLSDTLNSPQGDGNQTATPGHDR